MPEEYSDLPPTIEQSLMDLTEVDGHDLPLPALYLAATSWARLHGHIMIETGKVMVTEAGGSLKRQQGCAVHPCCQVVTLTNFQ